jgi:surface antigen
MRFRQAIIGTVAILALAGTSNLLSSTPTYATTSMTVSGVVQCNSGPVVGIWVQASGSGSGFASWTPLSITASAATYSKVLGAVATRSIQLHVGCGGKPTSWGSTSYTTTRTISSSHVLNTWCTVATHSCAAPASGKLTTYDMGESGNCTWEALKLFHSYEGWGATTWPYIVPSNASQWATTATEAGWSVRSVPVPDSILVFAPSQNHVAWVNSISANGSTLNITEMNHISLGVVDTRNIAESSAFRFIVAPWTP